MRVLDICTNLFLVWRRFRGGVHDDGDDHDDDDDDDYYC